MLINKTKVKQFALEVAATRPHTFTRVSAEFLDTIEARVRNMIETHVATLPSVGKTIK